MKHPLNNLRDAAEHIRLSDQEKSLVRAHLVKMVRLSESAARPKQPVATPYFFFFSFQRLAMPMAVLLIVALGGTTTYAAQGSLPGGVLYPVKIYVNENIQEALAVSEKAKVSFHTSVAQERLMEAEALASEGKLDAQTSSNIEANFNDHVAKADTIAATLEESDPASGVEARATLDSSIAAHSSILARIGDNSSDEQTKENSNSIAMRARSREQGGAVLALKAGAPVPAVMQTMSFSAEATSDDASSSDSSNADRGNQMMAKKAMAVNATATVATDTASQKKIAIQLQKKAFAQFDTTQESFKDSHNSLDASTTAKVKAQLSAIGDKFDAGKKQIKAENYDAARATFTEVIQASVELHTFVDASKLYKRDLIRSLLWGADTSGDENDNNQQDTTVSNPNSHPTTTVSSSTPSSTPVKDDTKKEDTEVQSGSDIHLDIHL